MGIKDLIQKRRLVKANKQLIKEFPFLLPRNRWTGEVSKDYDYTYTELDALPDGWRKAFGMQLCQELKDELVKYDYLYEYRILQIKEKYGTLRWYDNGYPSGSKIPDIIVKYERLSEDTCIICGKPSKYYTCGGYLNFICEDCKNRIVSSGLSEETNFKELEQ